MFSGVGTHGWSRLQRAAGDSYREPELPSGRSIEAVRRQIRRMCGSGARRGAFSLRQLAQATGYHPHQLKRAQRALNQSWHRMGRRGAYLISEDQMLDIVAWLAHDFWSTKTRLYCCTWCASSSRLHLSGGLCIRCFSRHRRRCTKAGLPYSLRGLSNVVENLILDCKNEGSHANFLERARRRLGSGLLLTKELLDWMVVAYDR